MMSLSYTLFFWTYIVNVQVRATQSRLLMLLWSSPRDKAFHRASAEDIQDEWMDGEPLTWTTDILPNRTWETGLGDDWTGG